MRRFFPDIITNIYFLKVFESVLIVTTLDYFDLTSKYHQKLRGAILTTNTERKPPSKQLVIHRLLRRRQRALIHISEAAVAAPQFASHII